MLTSEIILLIFVIAFSVLVVFLSILACYACITLKKLTQTMDTLEGRVDDLLEQTKKITVDANDKMRCLNPLFHSIDDLGEILSYKTNQYKTRFMEENVTKTAPVSGTNGNTMNQALEWALLGLHLWKKMQNKG